MMAKGSEKCLILASGSRTRHHMLQAAGLAFAVIPADVDEEAIGAGLLALKPVPALSSVAVALACAKAEAVSRDNPSELVIGSDQVLDFDGDIISKPSDTSGACALLQRLSGREHKLHSAAALAENGRIVWSTVDTARLTMRLLSAAFLKTYVARGGAALCQSAGAYQIESLGIQLFERVDGDHFTILGLPLMPLLAELRVRKIIVA